MRAERKWIPQYDLFKGLVAIFLMLIIVWLWWKSDQVSVRDVAIAPNGNVVFSGNAVPGSAVTLEIVAADGKTEQLTVQADDTGTWKVRKRFPPGKYRAAVKGKFKTSPPVAFNVPKTAALKKITATVSEDDRTLLVGSATPGQPLVLYLDNIEVARIIPDSKGHWEFSIKPFPGKHVIRLAYEEAPQVGSLRLTIDVPRDKPEPPSIKQAVHNSDNTYTISGKAPPGSEVHLWVDGKLAQVTTADADGNWSVDLPLPPGKHEIIASLKEDSFLAGSRPMTIEIPEASVAGSDVQPSENASHEKLEQSREEQEEQGFAYIVKEGDWLTKLARSYLGSEDRYTEIRDATNAKAKEDPSFDEIENADLIYPGEKIWIPSP